MAEPLLQRTTPHHSDVPYTEAKAHLDKVLNDNLAGLIISFQNLMLFSRHFLFDFKTMFYAPVCMLLLNMRQIEIPS